MANLQGATEQRARAALLDCQRRVLERIANAAPLPEILETLVKLVEEQASDMRCAVLLADSAQQKLRFAAAPNIPEDYKTGIEPFLLIAPNMGSCGTAAFRREPVYTRDTANDPLWENCGDVAVRNGLRAIWSTPILSDDNSVLGTFAMYYGEPRMPSAEHIQLIDMATQMARVAIEAKRAGDALRQSEDRLRLVIDTIPTMAWSLRPDGVVDFVNQRWLEFTGLSLEEALANATRTVHPEDLPGVMEKWRTDMAVGEPCEYELRLRRADGEYRWVLVRTVPLRNEQGNIVKWYGTSTDITERKKAENALRDSGVHLQALTRRLVELQESERKDLARELHDRVGQSLTALQINLGMLRAALSSRASSDITSRLDDCAALLESTARDIRSVESELRPPMLDDHGLLAALHWYANEFTRRAGIAVSVRGSQGSERARPEVEIALFRIAQEALNNVAKHARATSVVISFWSAGSEWRMLVVDDGVGLRPHEAGQPRAGFGLVTMRERAQAIGGRFDAEGLPQGGTRITVQVPT